MLEYHLTQGFAQVDWQKAAFRLFLSASSQVSLLAQKFD